MQPKSTANCADSWIEHEKQLRKMHVDQARRAEIMITNLPLGSANPEGVKYPNG